MLIHGTDGGHQAGVQESLHSFAELLRGTLGGTGNFRLQSLATSITGGAALRVERRKGRNRSLLGLSEDGIGNLVRLPLEDPKSGIHRALYQRLHFRGARIEFQERLLYSSLGILQHELVAAVGGAGGRRFELG